MKSKGLPVIVQTICVMLVHNEFFIIFMLMQHKEMNNTTWDQSAQSDFWFKRFHNVMVHDITNVL